jgi:hypothetical protein
LEQPTTTSAAATTTSISWGGHIVAASKPTPKAAQNKPVLHLRFTEVIPHPLS